MSRCRIKICGITSPDDARMVAAAGADAIGLVFHARSPRHLEISRAREIVAELPAFVAATALFVDAEAATVEKVLAEVPVDLLQFHGREEPAYCNAFGRRYIKAIRMQPGLDARSAMLRYPHACGILLDSYSDVHAGGTGTSFDWKRVPDDTLVPIVLAGGLRPENVADAVRRVRPHAVDVSSGVESAPGRKDPERVRRFIEAVRAGENGTGLDDA